MRFERGKDVNDALDLGLKKYSHVIRSYHENSDFTLDELIEFCRSGGKKYNSNRIRITVAFPGDVNEIHRYWKYGGKLPKEYRILSLYKIKGEEIVIRGKIYKVP